MPFIIGWLLGWSLLFTIAGSLDLLDKHLTKRKARKSGLTLKDYTWRDYVIYSRYQSFFDRLHNR